jgi:hypothetical protein
MKNIKLPSFVTEKNKYILWSMGYDNWFISHMKYDEYQKILMGDINFSDYIDILSKRLTFDEIKPIFDLLGEKYNPIIKPNIDDEIFKNMIINLN